MASKSKTFVSPYGASERVLAGGGIVVPGDTIDLDDEAQGDEHNKRLIEEGQLIEVQAKATTTKDGGEE